MLFVILHNQRQVETSCYVWLRWKLLDCSDNSTKCLGSRYLTETLCKKDDEFSLLRLSIFYYWRRRFVLFILNVWEAWPACITGFVRPTDSHASCLQRLDCLTAMHAFYIFLCLLFLFCFWKGCNYMSVTFLNDFLMP